MARTHHRKTHKQHLQNFKHKSGTVNTTKSKTKTAGVFGVLGFILGLAIGYITTAATPLWMGVFAITIGTCGYFIGQQVDKE